MEKETKKKIEEVKKESSGDSALQQVHIARKILSEEAKEKKIEFWKFIKMRVTEMIPLSGHTYSTLDETDMLKGEQ